MKTIIKFVFLSALLATLYGCTSGTYKTRLPAPDAMSPIFLRYKELPGQKVFVVAIDPSGEWAFGYDHGRETLAEAAENAAIKCDIARKKFKVFTKATLFAINDEVVYYNSQLPVK